MSQEKFNKRKAKIIERACEEYLHLYLITEHDFEYLLYNLLNSKSFVFGDIVGFAAKKEIELEKRKFKITAPVYEREYMEMQIRLVNYVRTLHGILGLDERKYSN